MIMLYTTYTPLKGTIASIPLCQSHVVDIHRQAVRIGIQFEVHGLTDQACARCSGEEVNLLPSGKIVRKKVEVAQ